MLEGRHRHDDVIGFKLLIACRQDEALTLPREVIAHRLDKFNYSVPARNHPLTPEFRQWVKSNYDEIRAIARS